MQSGLFTFTVETSNANVAVHPARRFQKCFFRHLSFFQLERNGQIQALIAVIAVTAAVWLKMARLELAMIFLCCGLVIGLEMMNSALEKLCDFVKPDRDPRIGFVKDVAAGAVLWASVASAAIGLLLFLPRLLILFR